MKQQEILTHTRTCTHAHVHTYTRANAHTHITAKRLIHTDTLLQAAAQGLVELPGEVGGAQHDHVLALLRVAAGRHAVHLNQQLRFHSVCCRVLIFKKKKTGKRCA